MTKGDRRGAKGARVKAEKKRLDERWFWVRCWVFKGDGYSGSRCFRFHFLTTDPGTQPKDWAGHVKTIQRVNPTVQQSERPCRSRNVVMTYLKMAALEHGMQPPTRLPAPTRVYQCEPYMEAPHL